MTPHDPATAVTDLDARDLICPMPVLRARKALRALPVGAVLRVAATDAAAAKDIPAFCQATGHHFLSADGPDAAGVTLYTLRKADG